MEQFSSTLKNALAYYIQRWRCSCKIKVVDLVPGFHLKLHLHRHLIPIP
jgi:hypothetical protein